METETEFEVLTWDKIYAMLLSQAENIRQSDFKPEVIIGVTRGEWVPDRVHSDLLEIPDLAVVQVEFYLSFAETRNEPVLTQGVSAIVQGKKVLLADDVDTGKSLHLAREHFRQHGATELRVVTVYRKPFSVITPDYCERETRCWVVFPWEGTETLRKIVEKHRDKSAVNMVAAKLAKAGLPKQLVKKFLKEEFEAGNC